MHFTAKPRQTRYAMLGNQNVLPMDRRWVVQEKEKANGILGCTKKNPLCHGTSPGETVSDLSPPFGAVILQQHRALTCCFTPP